MRNNRNNRNKRTDRSDRNDRNDRSNKRDGRGSGSFRSREGAAPKGGSPRRAPVAKGAEYKLALEELENQLEGRNPIKEAIRAGRPIERLLVIEGEKKGPLSHIIALAREQGIRVEEVKREVLDKKAVTGAHQGVIAMVAAKPYTTIEEILISAKDKGEAPLLLLGDGLQDPHNLGSLLRTCDATGAHGVVLPSRRSVGLTTTVAKTSAGAIEYVPVAKVVNLAQAIEALKGQGVWVIGADMNGEQLPWEVDFTVPTAIVVGAEGEGLGRLVADKCDHLVRIPMEGNVNSLNAGVAGALLLYEALRQRYQRK